MTVDPALGAALLAAVFAAVAGPLVLYLAHRTAHHRFPFGAGETAAVACLLGLLAAGIPPGPAGSTGPTALVVLGSAAAVVDAREGRLPNALTARLTAALLLAVGAQALTGAILPALRALTVAAALAGCCALVKLVGSHVLGWGDAKLIPVLGAALAAWRPDRIPTGTVTCVVLLGISTLGVAALTRTTRALVPYGPALLVGAATGLAVVR